MVKCSVGIAPNLQFCVTKLRSHTTLRNKARKRLNGEIKAYDQAEELLSISQAVKLYMVSKATLYSRINGRRNQVSYRISKQRLASEQDESIKSWVLEI